MTYIKQLEKKVMTKKIKRNKSENRSEKAKIQITFFAATFFTVIGIIVLAVILYLAFNDKNIFDSSKLLNLDKGSKIGDLIGGFAGVFFTVAGILLLYRTLQLQRAEFEKTHQIISNQQFENTFFNMLNVQMNIVNNSKGTPVFEEPLSKALEISYSGYELFVESNSVLNKFISKEFESNDHAHFFDKISKLNVLTTVELSNLKATLDTAYQNFYEKNGFLVGHYNRYFFSIVKFILEHKKEQKEIRKYLDILQAQLSDQEMGLLFYYANSSVGLNSKKEKLLFKWLDSNSFFRNISEKAIQDEKHHVIYWNTIFKFQPQDSIDWKKNPKSLD